MNKAYLGDGAYCEWDGHGLVLTAEDGIRATDRVVLEPEVFVALLRYAQEIGFLEPALQRARAR